MTNNTIKKGFNYEIKRADMTNQASTMVYIVDRNKQDQAVYEVNGKIVVADIVKDIEGNEHLMVNNIPLIVIYPEAPEAPEAVEMKIIENTNTSISNNYATIDFIVYVRMMYIYKTSLWFTMIKDQKMKINYLLIHTNFLLKYIDIT